MKRAQNGSRRRAPVQQVPSTTGARGSAQTRRSMAFTGATPAEHRGSRFSARTTEGGGNHGGRAPDAFTRALSLPGGPAPSSDALYPLHFPHPTPRVSIISTNRHPVRVTHLHKLSTVW